MGLVRKRYDLVVVFDRRSVGISRETGRLVERSLDVGEFVVMMRCQATAPVIPAQI